MFSATDVHWLCDLADRLGIDVWLDGGWAVDALLGHQTRPHGDLDLALDVAAGRRLHEALAAEGFAVRATGDQRPANYVLGRDHLLIDLHLVEWDDDGNGVLGTDGAYPAAGFTGTGAIAGRTVRCIEPPPQYRVGETFEELLAEGEAVPTAGWGFGWFDTLRHVRPRATEERPGWGYAGLLTDRITRATAVLDLQTGGGEVLAEALEHGIRHREATPGLVRATESHPPNLRIAANLLAPFGGQVTESPDEGPLPHPDTTFELVCSRHPTVDVWPEVARVLRPGGRYFAQHVGAASGHETSVAMLGPFEPGAARDPDRAAREAESAGLRVVDLRRARLRMEFFDVAALVHYLRKVVWMVPDFTVDRYRDQLARVHQQIESDGSFVAHSTRFLIDAVKD